MTNRNPNWSSGKDTILVSATSARPARYRPLLELIAGPDSIWACSPIWVETIGEEQPASSPITVTMPSAVRFIGSPPTLPLWGLRRRGIDLERCRRGAAAVARWRPSVDRVPGRSVRLSEAVVGGEGRR